MAAHHGDLAAHPDLAPFWQAVQQRELRFQHCTDCGTVRFYPRLVCPVCGSLRHDWRRDDGRGRVYAVTTVRMDIGEAGFDPPYQVALVDLDAGVRFLAAVSVERPVVDGDRVRVDFRTLPDGAVVPELVPDEAQREEADADAARQRP